MPPTPLPASAFVAIDSVVLDAATIALILRPASATAHCPARDRPSHHVHGRYVRTARTALLLVG